MLCARYNTLCMLDRVHWPAMTALNSIQIPSKTLHACCHNITADDLDA